MTSEEMKSQVGEMIAKSVEEKLKSANEQIEALKKADEEKTETIKNLVKAKENPTPSVKGKSSNMVNLKSALVAELKKNLNEVKNSNSIGMKHYDLTEAIEKSVAVVTTANITDGSGNGMAQAYSPIESGVTRVALQIPNLRNFVNTKQVTAQNFVRWTEATAGEGGAGATAEGAAKSQRDQDWVTKEMHIEKITSYTKVSEEMLEDIDFAAEEIANDLVEQVLVKEDELIYKGTGSSNQIKGLKEWATAFTVQNGSTNGEFYHAIGNATNLDVIRVACAIIKKAHFVPNAIIMHPSDVAKLELTKTTIGGYLNVIVNGNVFGLQVIENTHVSAGDFLVGDMSKANYAIRKDVALEMGHDSDDFTKNMVTIRCEVRSCLYVKSNQTTAFVKGTFSTELAKIQGTAPSQNVAITSPLNAAGDSIQTDEKA